jgi:twitching motility protein PilT
MDLADLLIDTRNKGASDLHLTVGSPPAQRINGKIRPLPQPLLDRDTLHTMIYDILTDDQKRKLERDLELDFALEFGDEVRFRANVYFNRRGEGAVFRVIPTRVTTLDELGMPPVLKELCMCPRGLILVTGPTGCGKSTTLAAMIDYINETREDHIITIEDPIEFVHSHKKCLVNQREVGTHTHSFANALRSALREDPDIILVGELRDLETIALAITAAETGHLVFGTLHTSSAPKTVDRLVDVFPPEQQEQIRIMLAESIQAVICQTLIPRIDRPGRVCAMEIMVATSAVRSLIREAKTHQLPSILQVSARFGMQNLDQVLRQLVYDGIISKDDAITHANNKFMFEQGEDAGGPLPTEAAGRRPSRPEAPADRASSTRPTPPLPPNSSAAPPSPSVEVEEDWMKIFGRKK